MLEAAAVCADTSLFADLRICAELSDEPFANELAADVLAAREGIRLTDL
ncbi:MAG: hypothetical protein KDE49_19735 [Novosphingobium sp.]|nr:hypothetical protein [Novosphingobium sp.]